MASSPPNPIAQFICLSLLLSFLSFVLSAHGASSVSDNQFSRKLPMMKKLKEKMSHLRFYFHDVVSGQNPTAVRVVQPPNSSSNANFMFGMVTMMDDMLTVGPEPTSRQVGRAQGIYASAALKELGFLMVMNLAFTEGKYNGSVLSVLGRNPPLNQVREMSVVGGGGLFRFARGYALAHTHYLDFMTGDAIVEYNVYVIHY